MKEVKVAAIPNKYTIIINYGLKDDFLSDEKHAYVSQELEVYVKGKDVYDPDTGDFLGRFDPIIEKLEITEVYDNFSVARKIKKQRKKIAEQFASPMLMEKEEKIVQKLHVNEDDLMEPLEYKSKISIGDLVKFV